MRSPGASGPTLDAAVLPCARVPPSAPRTRPPRDRSDGSPRGARGRAGTVPRRARRRGISAARGPPRGTAAADAATIVAASLGSPPGRQAGSVETVLHALAGAVEPAHDGANRDAEHLCRLLIVEPVHVDELEHLAVLRR